MTSASDEEWRLFIAIELPASLRRAISEHIDRLRQAVPEARASWTREENLHLTLKFLGNTRVKKVESVSKAVERTAQRVAPFEILVGGCGAFPPRGQPRVLWIGIDDRSGNLATAHGFLEEECAKVGLARESRPFHPHLTIARLRQLKGARELATAHEQCRFDSIAVGVNDLCLIRSELSSEGSRYTVIARHAFR